MREIKFRAWDKKNNKWLLNFKESGGFSLTGECVLLGEFIRLFSRLSRINEVEINQYTGLKDKNGKEIYEGDIIKINPKINPHEIIVVEYDAPTFDVGRSNEMTREVIGNIYENKELLKEQHEKD